MNWKDISQFVSDHPIATFGVFLITITLIEGVVEVFKALVERVR